MTVEDQAGLARSLGRVEGKMDGILASLVRLREELKEGDETRSKDRAETSASIRALEENMEGLVADIAGLKSNMGRVMPVAEQMLRWRNVGAGVMIALVLIGSFFGDMLLQAKAKIIGLLFTGE